MKKGGLGVYIGNKVYTVGGSQLCKAWSSVHCRSIESVHIKWGEDIPEEAECENMKKSKFGQKV